MSEEHPDQSRIHETEADRKAQREIVGSYCRAFGLTARYTPSLDRQDARLYDAAGSLVALAEAKDRHNTADLHRQFRIDAAKVDSLNDRAKAAGAVGLLIVRWEPGDTRWLDVTDAMSGWEPGDDFVWGIVPFRRRDRDELSDPAYSIPVGQFTRLTHPRQ